MNELLARISTSEDREEDLNEELRKVLAELRAAEDEKEGRLSGELLFPCLVDLLVFHCLTSLVNLRSL